MEKIIGAVLVVVYGAWFFTGQSLSAGIDESNQEIRLMETITHDTGIDLTQEQMHDTVEDVANKEGWITTKFKSNALIAEKTADENTVAVTITFSKSSFSISPNNSDLEEALNKHLSL